MVDTTLNLEKKYPIKAYQLLTERFDCEYCIRMNPRSRHGINSINANTQKCAFCGIGSQTFWLGMIIGLAEEIKVPITLIERVNCKLATKELIQKEKQSVADAKLNNQEPPINQRYEAYQVLNDTVYHSISVSSAVSKGIVNSHCFEIREDNNFKLNCNEDICSLDEWCKKSDIIRADRLFTNKARLKTDKKTGIRFWAVLCEISGLYEIMIPIYSKADSSSSYEGVIAVLVLGQIAIGSTMHDLPKIDGVNLRKINNFRKESWEKACISERSYKSFNVYFEKIGKSILAFINNTCDRLEIRVTDFLHNYQAELLGLYNDRISQPRIFSETNRNNSVFVKSAIHEVFKKIEKDFHVKRIFLFFPDMDLQDDVYKPILNGELISSENNVSCIFDTTDFKQHSSTRINIDEDKLSYEGEIIINNCEFYASAKGEGREKVVFGVLIEWLETPEQHGVLAHLHESMLSAFVGICVGEIAACISLAYSISQKAFAEETRHDLAHKLQTLEAHNYIFTNSIKRFEDSLKNYDDCYNFIMNSRAVINSNNDLYSTLTFLCNTLDNDNLEYAAEPHEFNPHLRIFPRLKNLYNASMNVIRKNQRLEISSPPSNHSIIYSDERMFNRIIYNLLDNAFKYGYPNTNIIIETEVSEDELWYITNVSNFCGGIEKSITEYIFDHGYHTNSSRVGNGLGLFVAKNFSILNHGTLNLTRGVVVNRREDDLGFILNKNITCGSEMWREMDRRRSVSDMFHQVYDEIKDMYVAQYDRPCSEIGVGKKVFRNVLEAIIPQPRYEKYKSPSDEALRKKRYIRYTPEQWIKIANMPIYVVTFTLLLPTYKNRKIV